jgi:large subunit ribosomal protein L18e
LGTPLFQLYRYLARRTGKKYNTVVLRRLFMSRQHRAPLSIARLTRFLRRAGNEKKIAVVVGTITDDRRVFEIPKMVVS